MEGQGVLLPQGGERHAATLSLLLDLLPMWSMNKACRGHRDLGVTIVALRFVPGNKTMRCLLKV